MRRWGGFDPSGLGALHLGIHDGLSWGRDLIYTYGPLGFLKVPTYWYSDTGTLAVLYAVITRIALFTVLWSLGRRSFGWPGAVAVLLLIGVDIGDPVPVLAFAACLWVLVGEPQRPGRDLGFALAGGAWTALELLAKINVGVTVGALWVATLLFLGRAGHRRGAVAFAGSLIVGLVVLWLLAGQPLGALPDYLHNAARLSSGYSAAMATELPGLAWQYSAALIVFLLGLMGVWTAFALRPPRARWGAVVLWIVLAFLYFKEGFARHDGHALFYFSALMGALAALPWDRRHRVLGLTAIAVPFLILLAVSGQRIVDLVSPLDRLSLGWDQATTVVRPAEQRRIQAEARTAMHAVDGLDPTTLALLSGQSVDIEPSESVAAWGYGLRWRPLPVYQRYVAYTQALDQLNTASLRAPDGPQRILLRAEYVIDGRVGAFEAPAATREILCRYVPLHPQPPWVVLGREAGRCGPARRIATVSARWGQDIAVPRPSRPDALIFVRISGVSVGGLERIRDTLYRAYFRSIAFNHSDVHRLLPETAADGLIMSVPGASDYPPPWTLAPAPKLIAIQREGDPPTGPVLRMDFYEQPIAPSPGSKVLQPRHRTR